MESYGGPNRDNIKKYLDKKSRKEIRLLGEQ
jgi:hypothetical protein